MSTGKSIFKNLFFFFFIFSTCVHSATELRVEKITFIGNNFYSSQKLASIIKSGEHDPFDSRLMKLDQVLLKNFYLRNGFLNVSVSSDFTRKADKISLEYTIDEGRRYFLKSIDFVGNTKLSDQELRKKMPLKLNEPYQSQLIAEGLIKIEGYYLNNGKPFVEIEEDRQVLNDSLIALTVDIKENQTVTIAHIQINGLESVRTYVANREIEIEPGDVYSKEKIELSQRNLYSTGLFKFVHFNIVTMDSQKTKANLIVKVEEKKSRWVGLRFGVAYEQEIIYGGTFDFGVEGGHRNLFGTGRSASLSVIPSLSYDFQSNQVINPKNQYSFTYVEPWIGFTRTRGILKISYFQVRPTRTANYNFFSSSFRVTHEFPTFWTVEGELAYQNINTDSLALVTDLQGQDKIYSIALDVINDKRDNYLNTKNGHLLEFRNKFVYSKSFELADNGNRINRFFKLTATWNRYQPFPLFKSWTLASRIRGGTIIGINRLTRIPPTERFYLGGASSVRGYPEQLLGPVTYDDQGNAVALGGRYMILGNLELRIPLFWLFYGTIFTDGGNVWRAVHNIDFLTLKASSGAGLALMTPLGAIRFDYGVKWFPAARESRGEFDIGISFAF